MIPVIFQPEPADFALKIRQPGNNFIRLCARPTAKDFKRKPLWKSALADMKKSYGSICAYTSMYITSDASIDHFLPKSSHPHLAYEWTNYRLAISKINTNKGDSRDVLDPFTIQPGWFILDIASLHIRPNSLLPSQVSLAIQKTIDILKLNAEEWVEIRFEILNHYLNGDIQIGFLEKKYPFIALEVKRQAVNPR